jgi:hypothetical protein
MVQESNLTVEETPAPSSCVHRVTFATAWAECMKNWDSYEWQQLLNKYPFLSIGDSPLRI